MSLILPITNKCNQNCLFCSSSNRKDKTNFTFLKEMIDGEPKNLIITGGEPTISSNLFALINYAKRKKLSIELQTNGNTMCSVAMTRKLVKSEIDLFNINFTSHLEQLNDYLTQTHGSFKKKIKGLKNIQQTRARVRLTHVINALTYKYLNDLVLYVVHELPKFKFIQFSFIKIMGETKNNPDIILKYEQVKPSLIKAIKTCEDNGIEVIIDHIPPCYLDRYNKYHADFQKIKIGKIPNYSKLEKTKITTCKNCNWSGECFGIRKDYLEYFSTHNETKQKSNN